MDKEAIDRRDLHGCAVHEAGHLVLLACYGLAGEARVMHRPTAPEDYGRLCQYSGRVSFSQDPPEYGRAAVGLAGEVAQMWDKDPNMHMDELMDAISYDVVRPSQSDWEMSGIHPEHTGLYDALASAVDALRQHTAFFEWCVGELEESGAVTSDMVEAEARRQGVWGASLKG